MGVQPLFFLFCFFLPFVASWDQTIYINLVPKDYINPRTAEDFICGVDKSLAPEHLIAELNSHFIFDFMDKTEESDGYQSKVYDVVLFSQDGQPKRMTQCPLDENTGLFSFFVSPPKSQCNSGTFSDAIEANNGYYPVFVGTSCKEFRDAIEIFEQAANTLKSEYEGKFPKLCGTLSTMTNETANNRAKTMNLLFNFAFDKTGPSRALDVTDWKVCESKEQTENAIVSSEIFDINFNIEFKKKKVEEEEEGSGMNRQEEDESDEIVYVNESEGYVEFVVAKKEKTNKKAVILIETEFSSHSEFASADENDIVPFNGPAVFEANSNEMSVFVRIKEDSKNETAEYFAIRLKPLKQRMKRSSLADMLIEFVITETQPTWIAMNPPTVFEMEQITNRPTIEEWVTSLKTNLVGTEDNPQPGQNQNFVFVFTLFESIIPPLEISTFETTSYLDEDIIQDYEISTPSCDKTARSLTMTYLKELTRIGDWWNHENPCEQVPWQEGLSSIRLHLNLRKIVRVELTVRGTASGNHFFTMWSFNNGHLGIVHGWQGVFCAKVIEHAEMGEALDHLKKMLIPLPDASSIEHEIRIGELLTAFKNFFGNTVDDLPMLTQDYSKFPRDIFHIREIFTGYPSQTISSAAEGCMKSRVYQENFVKMTGTRNLCNEELRKYIKRVV